MKVDLALAYTRDEGFVRVALVIGARQETFDFPRSVAATLIGEMARALVTAPLPKRQSVAPPEAPTAGP